MTDDTSRVGCPCSALCEIATSIRVHTRSVIASEFQGSGEGGCTPAMMPPGRNLGQ